MKFSPIFVFGAWSLALGPAFAQTLSFPPQSSGIVQFVTPAKEVGCTYIPFDGAGGIDTGTGTQPELHCYRMTGKFAAASLGPSQKSRPLVVEGRLDCCKGRNILAYGHTWKTGGYACTAMQGGLTCKRGNHGFSITMTSIKHW
jgi:hypothetical protein